MGRDLTIELSEAVYTALERHARAAAQSPAELAAEALEQRFAQSNRTRGRETPASEVEGKAARLRFERHFGAVNLGYATGVDNEAIDAELARTYADHNEGS
jgi:predicted transcriptional regulator